MTQSRRLRRLALRLSVIGAIAVCPLPLLAPAHAQNLFAPVLYVNGEAITQFEVEQRARFLEILRAPGDPREEALRILTEERLQRDISKRLDLKLGENEVREGMEEFAGRVNMTADELMAEFATAGIAPETFRDFVSAGLLWRQAVRARFAGRVSITDADVDRALEATARSRALRAQVSELVIPAQPGEEQEALALANRLSQTLRTEAAFAAAAREYSASPTAENGGRIPDWLAINNLPPAIANQLVNLGEGEVSQPMVVPNAVVLFQLRSLGADPNASPGTLSLEWAEYMLPDDAATIAHVRATVDKCNDLNGLAKGQPENVLRIRKAQLAQVPQDVALELARLDAGETAVSPAQGGQRRLVMLCQRVALSAGEDGLVEPSRARVREQLLNQRIEAMAANYLAELRFAAKIRTP